VRFRFLGGALALGYGIIRCWWGRDCQVKWQNRGDYKQEQEVQHKVAMKVTPLVLREHIKGF